MRASHVDCEKVQDPYSLRCQPQVMGACLDLLRTASATLLREANAVTDNPLVFARERVVLSGGNFHAEPVAFAADQLALAVAEIGSIAERRIAILVDTKMSGLPPFLVANSGVNSGFMVAQVTAAALASENKSLAHPASVDSIPTSANQEDHVSMATYAARRLLAMADNAAGIVAIELLAAAQGLNFHRPLRSSTVLESVHRLLRRSVPMLTQRPVLRARHRRGAPSGGQRRTARACHAGPVRALASPRAIVTADLAVHTFATHTLLPGDSPLIISVPHAGTAVPQELAPRLTPLALDLPDTDWHVARLYDFAPALGATMIVARYTRYLIDLNRPPDDAALYSAAAQTGLCPTQSFAGEPLYRDGTDQARRGRNRAAPRAILAALSRRAARAAG